MGFVAGEYFAGFRILRPLGAGGMGQVYLVEHPRLPRHEALKVLSPQLSADPDYRERFAREADLAGRLWHPHIVEVRDRGENGGQLWISMAYVDGQDAARLLAEKYPAGMPAEEVIAIVNAVASALDYAHEQGGTLHRDVKPANIFLSSADAGGESRVLLGDFGIARELADPGGMTATGMALGTLAYSAPEQLSGDPLDGRADQYALAATAYHLLTGTLLFPVTNPVVAISRHLSSPPPKLSASHIGLAPMDDILAKALSKNPSARYPRCVDFAQALAASATGGTSHLLSPSAPTQQAPVAEAARAVRANRRRYSPANSALTGALVVGLVAGAAVFWKPWATSRDHTATPTATSIVPSSPAAPPTNRTQSAPSPSSTESTPRLSTAASPSTPNRASAYEFGQPLWPFHGDPGWQPTGGLSWAADPALTTLKFTQEFLGFTELDRITTVDVQSGEAWVGVGQADPSGRLRTAATVHLERLNTDAPWAVIGTEDTSLTFEVPAYGSALPPSCAEFAARLACPILEVGGTVTGVDEALKIRALQVPLGGSRESSSVVGEFCCLMTGGQRSAWSAKLPLSKAPFPGPPSDPPWPVTIVVSMGGHYATVEQFAITAVTTSR